MSEDFDDSVPFWARVWINIITPFMMIRDAIWVRPPRWQREIWNKNEEEEKKKKK